MQTELALWWLLLAYFQKIGSPQLRRRLADLIIAVVPDKNLSHMRDIINTMDHIVQEIFGKRSREVDLAGIGDVKEAGASLNMLSILREFFQMNLRPLVTVQRKVRANKLSDESSRLSDEEFQGQMT